MKNYIILGLVAMFGFLLNCGGSTSSAPAPTAGTGDFSGFNITPFSNANGLELAKAYDDKTGSITSEGPISGGQRDGTWIKYHTGRDTGKIKSVTNYHNGQKTGVELEFATNGSVNKRVDYDGGVIHGVYAEYKYNRPLKYAEYTQGKLNGVYKTFYNNGKLQQMTKYKNDKKEGVSVFYNEEEQIIMEYNYKNGEQVSGGKVTPSPTTAPQ